MEVSSNWSMTDPVASKTPTTSVDLVAVHVGTVGEAVGAEEFVPDGQARILGHFRSDDHFEGRIEHASEVHFRSVVRGVAGLGSDDAVQFIVVSIGQRYGLRDVRVAHDLLGLDEGNVPGRNIHVVDIGEDELERAALGAQHKVDVLDVAVEVLCQAPLHERG